MFVDRLDHEVDLDNTSEAVVLHTEDEVHQ
jgi:hypothetical protein